MLAIKSINGTVLAVQPQRDGFQITRSDLLSSGSGRSAETGKAIRYMIRPNVYKLTLKFKGPLRDIAQVYELVSEKEFEVTFLDGTQYIEGHTFYPSDRALISNGFTAELSVNLIEL